MGAVGCYKPGGEWVRAEDGGRRRIEHGVYARTACRGRGSIIDAGYDVQGRTGSTAWADGRESRVEGGCRAIDVRGDVDGDGVRPRAGGRRCRAQRYRWIRVAW